MAGTSSLLKSAANIRDQLASYQDSLQAYEYSNSAYTDDSLNGYKDYLDKRINSLQTTGSISDQSKALTLIKARDSATKSNISATIQRENIQMLSGNATLQDKYGVVVQQYSRAVANGDMTLAQSLMGQAYSIDQSIQLQAQQAADARVTLAKAAATTGKQSAADEDNLATNLEQQLGTLNQSIKGVGMKGFNSTVKAWVNANKDTLEALGVKLPDQPNYWDIVQGVAGAKYNHYMLSSQMYAPYGTGPGSQSWNEAAKAEALNSGATKISTLGGSLSVQDIMSAAQNPGQFIFNPSQGKFVQTQQTGYSMQFDKSNPGAPQVAKEYSGTIEHTVVLDPTATAEMHKLGLNFGQSSSGNAADGVQVQSTDKTPVWLKQVLGNNGATNMYLTPNGLQFMFDNQEGTGQSLYTITKDANGKLGVFAQNDTSEGYLHGEYGFNPTATAPTPPHQMSNGSSFGFQNFKNNMHNWFGGIAHDLGHLFGGLTGHASADALLGNATGHYQAPLPIPIAQPTALPTISLPQPAPLPQISVSRPVANTQAVVPHTAPVQQTVPVNTFQGGAGAGINQSSGKGITIKGVTNQPVGMRL